MVNDAIPFFEDGDEITCTATAAVQGKHFVIISGNRQADGTFSVAPAVANSAGIIGIAQWDAATGKRVTVKTIEAGNIMPVVAGGVIAAGAYVTSDANAAALTATTGQRAVGICLDGAASGADAMILTTRATAP